ncbi:putative S-adenosylmethionine-dependent methyltransferase/MSMEI_2290 [Phycisphaerae bacterium RAS2]|nr:putative S-adenosylmethionine-dependent methyltransferase/MSMEI_2290 [Phycisphaerae bacterium RAS2]
MVQQQPRYSADELARLYSGDYYVFDEDDAHRAARAAQQYAVHLAPIEHLPSRRLLDVGCALGHFSALARDRGWQVVGLDVSADAARRATERFGIKVFIGTLEEHAESLSPFDAVFLGDVIEHVPHPLHFLRDVRRVLAPSGIVCIDTPNWGGFWRRWGGRHWLGLNRFHINLFDASSLANLLTSAGFTNIVAGSYTHHRYTRLASRPEIAALIARLSRALAWRVNRLLTGRSRRDANGPAPSTVARFQPRADLRGDNLIARAKTP